MVGIRDQALELGPSAADQRCVRKPTPGPVRRYKHTYPRQHEKPGIIPCSAVCITADTCLALYSAAFGYMNIAVNEVFRDSIKPSSYFAPGSITCRLDTTRPNMALSGTGLGDQITLTKIDKLRALNIGTKVPLPQVNSTNVYYNSWQGTHVDIACCCWRPVVWEEFSPGELDRILYPRRCWALHSLCNSDHLLPCASQGCSDFDHPSP